MTFCFVYMKNSLFLQYRTIVFDYEMILSGFAIMGLGAWKAPPPSYNFFWNPPPTKTDASHGQPTPHLKIKLPQLKSEIQIPCHWKVKPPRKWFLEKNQKKWKLSLSLIFVLHSSSVTEKRWQKFHQNMIFSHGVIKIL